MKSALYASAFLLGILIASPVLAGRLFGTESLHGLIEIDPLTGDVLNQLPSPELAVWDGLAFDGNSLWLIGEDTNTLYQMNPENGTIQNSYPLPHSDFRAGLAYLNDLIYILDWSVLTQDITVFDPQLETVVNTLDYDAVNPGGPLLGGGGLSAISGPDALFVNTAFTDEVLMLDPLTGLIVDQFSYTQVDVLGAAAVDGEIYLASHVGLDNQIKVYDRSGSVLRSVTVTDSLGLQSLAGSDTAEAPNFNADFTGDGFVNTFDYHQWQGDFGMNADSDADSDNDTDGLDFLIWQQRTGGLAGASASAAVIPEPTSVALIMTATIGLLLYRRNHTLS